MAQVNPYEPPLVVDRRQLLYRNVIHRVVRVLLLGAIGYGVYFGGVYVAALLDASVSTPNAGWEWGGIVAFALVASEIFVIEAWSLRRSLIRRLIVSCTITIASIVIAGQFSELAGIELRQYRAALFLPRLGIGLPSFIILAIISRRWLNMFSRANRPN
ncbi:MAG: hypothetical protein FJ295_15715 [Planctomycetes bacterium]|nr:hypothetical protein [Planctomycetota bacterium]